MLGEMKQIDFGTPSDDVSCYAAETVTAKPIATCCAGDVVGDYHTRVCLQP